MKIARNGQEFELTQEELSQAFKESRTAQIRSEVEYFLKDHDVSFDNYKEFDNEYSSAADARADFIEYCVESYIDHDELYFENMLMDIDEFTSDMCEEWDLEVNY